MFSKAKYIFSSINKNILNSNHFQYKKFSTKEAMRELNLNKKDVEVLTHLIKQPWVKPGKEKLVN